LALFLRKQRNPIGRRRYTHVCTHELGGLAGAFDHRDLGVVSANEEAGSTAGPRRGHTSGRLCVRRRSPGSPASPVPRGLGRLGLPRDVVRGIASGLPRCAPILHHAVGPHKLEQVGLGFGWLGHQRGPSRGAYDGAAIGRSSARRSEIQRGFYFNA
jgi:hypothetical protein